MRKEETLSDHRYITYSVKGMNGGDKTEWVNDYVRTDWERFRGRISEYEEGTWNSREKLEEEV